MSWRNKKQPTIALSSIEAKYRGVAWATCEIASLHKLSHDLGHNVSGAITLNCDNMSSIQLATNMAFHTRTKHIEVHYHYVCEKILARGIDLLYVSTQEHVADIFTRSLGAEKLQSFKRAMGV